jgi:hypothetical protein
MNRDEKGEFFREVMSWDSRKLTIEIQKKVEEHIRSGEARFFAEAYFLRQVLLLKNGGSSFFSDYSEFKGDFMKLMQISAPSMLQNYFFNGKVFSMTQPVYDLLQNTKNKVFLRKHPFYVFAIDQKVKTKYEGLNILFTIFFEVSANNKEPTGCNYLVLGMDERDKSEYCVKGHINNPLKNIPETEVFSKEELIEIHRKVRELYSNFLDYLNHPYSKQTIYKLSYNNSKRIKRGKFPNQDKIIIDIKPEFFDVRRIGEKKDKNPFQYKFWVRGHFKHFRNKERYKRIYSLSKTDLEKEMLFYNGDFISKWVVPYIKGTGQLKEKLRRQT